MAPGVPIAVDTRFCKYLDHGYAANVQKAQDTTSARTYVLAIAHFDRHTAYVVPSRHDDDAFTNRKEGFGERARMKVRVHCP